ncbi:MAG: D-aminoacylase [Anaerolineae bacterium]|nr:D-aminoacylase [Anaerolineae bacterium]
MTHRTIVIRRGLVVDGSGAPGAVADVLVEGEWIVAVGALPDVPDATVIDGHGKVVCPGFIDVHVHSEAEILKGCHTAGVQMGVTTELVSPDGMSFAPLSAGRLAEYRRYLRAIYGDDLADWPGGSLADYLARFAGRMYGNVVAQAPHGAIRLAVKGWEPGPASEDELAAMGSLLRECLEAGAVGLSTGLEYAPAAHADARELVALAREVARGEGVVSAHLRAYGDGAAGALEELLSVARETGAALHISHFPFTPRTYALAEAAVREVDITWDAYPYTAGCTMLAYALPPEALHTGIDQLLADLQRPEVREMVRPALEARFPPGCGASFAALSQPHNRWLEGMTLEEASARAGKGLTDLVCDLLLDEELAPLLILPWPGSPAEQEMRLRRTLTHPRQMVASDGIFQGRRAHPRAWGTYPRILGRYVRELGWLALEDAVRRMSGFPAARFGLRDRGLLRPGLAADIVVFDPATVADRATHEAPRLAPAGIEHVLVNGVPVVQGGRLTGARPGRVLRA